MRVTVRDGFRRCHDQSGNIVLLMTVLCLLIVLLSLVSLDVFSILASRRYAQTDADAAATAAVRAMQPVVTSELMSTAQAKVDRLLDEALQQWREEGSVGDPSLYIGNWLSEAIEDPYVVAYILGQAETPPDAVEFLTAVLTPVERGCALERVALRAQETGRHRAEQFLRDPARSALQIQFPYQDRAWVMVAVQRPVPTVFVRRLLSHTPQVQTVSGATLQGLADVVLAPCR